MPPFANAIPGTEVTYEMVSIPGGEFLMGSPEGEKDRKPDEGPQHKVKISPFWMGRYEVTWDQYLLFMYPDDEKNLRETFNTPEDINKVSDAVTRPSKPYVSMDFGMGKSSKRGGKGFPAIAMTQHGAKKFCHWLSAKTGHFYRLLRLSVLQISNPDRVGSLTSRMMRSGFLSIASSSPCSPTLLTSRSSPPPSRRTA